MARSYFRVMLGKKSVFADECYHGSFIGADFGINRDLSKDLSEDWRAFNRKHIPQYLELHPEKTKVSAGLACGFLWTVSKGIKQGDVVLCPNGEGEYYVGEVVGDYQYFENSNLPHRRKVSWYSKKIVRSEMSQKLRNSSGSIGTVSNISEYASEIEGLLGGITLQPLTTTDQTIEDPSVFALEMHLEDFLIENWQQTELSRDYDIYEEDGELVGKQYQTDTGRIDILAISKDKKELLVIELKKGRASDSVVGQIQRYMGYVIEELAEANQAVRGIIIALEDDQKIRRALRVTQNIEFYRYEVSFKLFRSEGFRERDE